MKPTKPESGNTVTQNDEHTAEDALNARLDQLGDAIKAVRFLHASQLQRGDVCVGSGATVLRGAARGLHTPKGKVELIVHYPGSKPRLVHWLAETRILVDTTNRGRYVNGPIATRDVAGEWDRRGEES